MFANVIKEMIEYFGNDTRRIAHALKVYAYTKTIGELENLDSEKITIAILSAILHDLGIKIAEEKYGFSNAQLQEIEGPPIAERILKKFNFDENIIERVKFIIANHHHPNTSEDIDFSVIIDADYLVNLEEGDIPIKNLDIILTKHFKTKTGIYLAETMFK